MRLATKVRLDVYLSEPVGTASKEDDLTLEETLPSDAPLPAAFEVEEALREALDIPVV